MIRKLRSDARKQRIMGWISAVVGAGFIYTVIQILWGREDLSPFWQAFFLLVLAWIYFENAYHAYKESKVLQRIANSASTDENGTILINFNTERSKNDEQN